MYEEADLRRRCGDDEASLGVLESWMATAFLYKGSLKGSFRGSLGVPIRDHRRVPLRDTLKDA